MSDPGVGNATIELTREKAFSFAAQSFRVFVDGVEVARLRNGTKTSLAVEPGPHTIKVKALVARAGEAEVSVAADDAVQIVCGPVGQRIQVVVLPASG